MASYLIMTLSSLDDLNQRLAEPVTDYHFRPNIVIKGTKPYEEDSWDWIKIGEETVFRGFKPCTRLGFLITILVGIILDFTAS